MEDLEVDGSPFWVFFGAPGSLDVDEAAKAAEEAMAAAAAAVAGGGVATAPAAAPPGSMAAAAQAAAAAASSAAPYAVFGGLGMMGMPGAGDPFSASALAAAGGTAPKVIGSALGSMPIATPASIAAAAAGNPLAAAAAAAAAFSAPGGAAMAAGLGGPPNPIAAAMASAAAAAAAGATFVDPWFGNPIHKQLACQLLAAKGVPDIHKACVVVSKYPLGLDDAKMKALMGVAGERRAAAVGWLAEWVREVCLLAGWHQCRVQSAVCRRNQLDVQASCCARPVCATGSVHAESVPVPVPLCLAHMPDP